MKTKKLFRNTVTLTVIASFLCWNMAMAAPEGGNVVQGSAAITQSGTTTTINQISQNTVINWQGFNTASNESVRFNQPSSSAVALNRITSGLPTTFAGQLTANGQVWILNPAGVLFTNTSKIDVSGLVATTLSIKDSDFMAGKYNLFQSPGALQGSVINNGLITSHDNGLVALVAPTVANNGTIIANTGNVLLASGTVATIDPYGDNLINFAPNGYAVEGSVTNTGTITANSGKVVMTANSINKIIKNVVNDGGMIEAHNAVQSADGVIILGGNSGTTAITGTIKSNKIIIKGHDTVISGDLSTPAGGTIETSGETVKINPVAVINPGVGGLWYLDPLTIDIAADYGNLIQNLLQAGTSVTLSTGVSAGTGDGNIFVDQAITWNTAANLTLMAYSNIYVSQPITSTGPFNVITLHADVAGAGGAVYFSGAGHVTTNGLVNIYYHPSDNFPNTYISPTNFTPNITAPVGYLQPYMTVDSFNNYLEIGGNEFGNYALNVDVSFSPGVVPFGLFTHFHGILDGHDYITGGNHTISSVDSYGDSPASLYRGGITAENYGLIENVNVNGSVSAIGGTSDLGIGGIAGYNAGTIYNVLFTGSLQSNNGAVAVGGLVGINDGGNVVSSGSTGSGILAAGNAGGIVGISNNGGNINNDFSWMPISAGNRGGIIGRIGSGNVSMQYDYYAGNSSGMDAFIGNWASGAGAILDANIYLFGSDHCVSCTTNSITAFGGVSLGFSDAFLVEQIIWTSFAGFDFSGNPGAWTTQGDSQLPTIIRQNISNNLVLLSGSLSTPAVQTVSLYGGNNFIGNFSTNASGDFSFEYNPDAGTYAYYLATTNGATVKGAILKTEPTNIPVTNLNITNNSVIVDGAIGFSNSNLAVATSNAPYSVSGNNLTLSAGVSFLTTAITPYTLNGNITAPGASGIVFNNTVSLSAASILTSGGVINFSSTLNGGFALTANASGAVTFGGNVGGATQLTGLTVASNGPITEGGFIKVNGASSFSAGANPITLTNVNNIFVGAVTLSNAGANNVNIFDGVNLILAASTIGGNLNATSGGSTITLNGNITSGASQAYNNNVLLGGSNILTATTGNIDFTGTINGGFALTADAPAGTVIFGSDVGGSAQLTGLTVVSNGAITPAGFIKVNGPSNFTAGANPITLTNSNNIFVGNMVLSNTGNNNVDIYDSVSLGLGTSTVGGIFSASTGGSSITINGVITSTSAPVGSHSIVIDPFVFINNAGPGAFVPGPGNYFLVYLATPVGSTFGGLNSGNQAIWNQTAGSLPPANVPAGSFYIFANQPTATITTISAVKNYGTDLTGSVGTQYSGSGFVDASLYGNVFTQDTVANSFVNFAPTSPGAAANAPFIGSPYAVTVPGSITPTTGYAVSVNNAGTITVNKAPLTINANSQTKAYGQALSSTTHAFTPIGLQLGETINTVDITSAGLATSATIAGSPYPITSINNAQGGTAVLSNYSITYNALGNISVVPAVLIIKPLYQVKYLGFDLSPTTMKFSVSGLLNGDTINTVDITSAGLAGNTAIGFYPITGISNATGGTFNVADYVISYVPAGAIYVLPSNIASAIATPKFDLSGLNYNYCATSGCDNLTIDASLVDVGFVTDADGTVTAVDDNGGSRFLAVGDTVFAGETIITGPDSHLCIRLPGGTKKCFGPNERYKV